MTFAPTLMADSCRWMPWSSNVSFADNGFKKIKKIILWFTAPKEDTPVNYISATDWQMAVRPDNVISITLLQV